MDTTELETLIELRYGTPAGTEEYLDSLPTEILSRIYARYAKYRRADSSDCHDRGRMVRSLVFFFDQAALACYIRGVLIEYESRT